MTSGGGPRWIAFAPRDTVVVRDGRTFDAGTPGPGSQAKPVTPWPSTVAGAVTTAFTGSTAFVEGGWVEPGLVRGPVRAYRDGAVGGSSAARQRWVTHFPVPADLVLPDGEPDRDRPQARRLVPLSLWRGQSDAEGLGVRTDLGDAVSSWLVPPEGSGSVEPVGGLLPVDAMTDYLADTLVDWIDLRALDWVGPSVREAPLVGEQRVGLARNGRTARDGYLYAMTHQRPREGWGFLAECVDGPATAGLDPAGPVPFGGRSRLADVEVADAAWPQPPDDYPRGRVLVYVATPAVWEGGWLPPLPEGVRLVAAGVPDPVPVSVASARRARRDGGGLLSTVVLRWAVPAGAVYLLEFPDRSRAPGVPERSGAQWAQQWAASVHARALGPAQHPGGGSAVDGPGSAGTDRTATAGFGVVLTGRWGTGADR